MTQLGGFKVSELRSILEQEGGSMKSHNPNSWPKQAKLAAAGKTKELKSFQAELFGGK